MDLEETIGGVWELDIASAITLHHPLFADENGEDDWLENFGEFLQEGYQKKPDPKFLRFFRLYHLLEQIRIFIRNRKKMEQRNHK